MIENAPQHRTLLRAGAHLLAVTGVLFCCWSLLMPEEDVYLGRVLGMDVPLAKQWLLGLGLGVTCLVESALLFSLWSTGWWIVMAMGVVDVVHSLIGYSLIPAILTTLVLAYLYHVRSLFDRRLI